MLEKYIRNNFLEINDWRGIEKAQFRIMNDCYKNNYDKFEWLIFYDIDEFIFLRYYRNIKVFLCQTKFDKCEKIQLNWIHRFEDKETLFYENKSLLIRFPNKERNILKKNFYPQIKSILRGHIPNLSIGCIHNLVNNLESCNGFGKKSLLNGINSIEPDFKNNYINHYYGKSLEEFVEKVKNGCAALGKTNITMIAKIIRYFEIYNKTEIKIRYIENQTGLNLSIIRNQ